MHIIGRKNIKKKNVNEYFKNISLKFILRIFFLKNNYFNNFLYFSCKWYKFFLKIIY